MSEREIQQQIRLSTSKHKCRLFRNQVGHYTLSDGRHLTSGLCVGSSDLIGWTELEITPDMLGQTVAIFTAVEVKTATGRITKEQSQFISAVNKAGGFGGVCRSVEDALCVIGKK